MKLNLPVTGKEQRFSAEKSMVTKTNTKGIITFANKDFIEISGFSEEELVGKNHNLIRHPDMPPVAFEIMWKTLKRGLPWHGIVKNRCKNGDHYWVDARIVPIKKKGEIIGYMSVRSCPSREDVAKAEAEYKAIAAAPETVKENFDPGWKKYWSIKNGIPLWIFFVTLLMIGGGVIGVTGINMSNSDIQALYHKEMVPVQAINRINFLMSDNRAQVALAINFKFGTHSEVVLENGAGNVHLSTINKNKEEIDNIWKDYSGKITDPKERQLADDYAKTRAAYVNEGLLRARQAIEAEDYFEAQRIFFQQVNPLYEKTNARTSALLAYLTERSSTKLVDTTYRGDLVFKFAVAGISLSCLVLILAGIVFFRLTAKPLEKAVVALEDIAEGNLSNHIDPNGYGEPGRVMTAVMVTQMHLNVMIHEIQQSSDSIRKQCNNLNKVMMNLAEHSDEQHDRIYQTVGAVEASRTAMTVIAGHMDDLLGVVQGDDDSDSAPMSDISAADSTPVFELMPDELKDIFGDSFTSAPTPAPVPSVEPTPAPLPVESTLTAAPPTPTADVDVAIKAQVQAVASATRGQSLAVDEVAGQLSQVAGLVVQNREDVQMAWAASQKLEATAYELDELVKYFAA